jgi:Ca-activated chloride channel family protein
MVLVCSVAAFGQGPSTEGSLYAAGKDGASLGPCPLKTTSVNVEISGFITRVRVRQEFENSFAQPIEAIYVFPLSQNGAVDDMKMTIGERVIRGMIMKRAEARQVYETAKAEGKTAALLDQERTNVFTQSVANIMPGERVIVEISYVETLKYEDGAYEWVFPMTVAPRYNPASMKEEAKIRPPVAATRAGHDVSIEVNLNAGVPIEDVRSTTHVIDLINISSNTAKVTLHDDKTIPNKDFILRYDVTGKRIEDAVLSHRDERGGFFTLILQPPDKITSEDRTPKEIVFVLDTSGSMSGFPIEKAKEAMRLSLDGLYPEDTFNVITFAGDTAILFDGPVPATRANLDAAQAFLAGRQGGGGTEMMKAIKASLDPSDATDHLRIVCFMTDGEVGNDDEIVAEVQRHPKARVFAFGIGSSVNRSLLDRIAQEGRGEATYVGLDDDGSKAARKFYERVRSPLLTDLSIDWNGVPVTSVYPKRPGDLFSAKPVIVHGRYDKAASGTIKLKGQLAGQPYERNISFDLPESSSSNEALASLWARTRIDELTSQRLKAQDPKLQAELVGKITDIALRYRLMTEFTSFVAVEDKVVNQGGSPVTVQVPVERPEGTAVDQSFGAVSSGLNSQLYQNIPMANGAANLLVLSPGASAGGGGGGGRTTVQRAARPIARKRASSGSSSGGGSGSGTGTGYGSGSGSAGYSSRNAAFVVGDASGTENTFIVDGQELTPLGAKTISTGVLNGKAVSLIQPEYPAAARAVNMAGPVVVEVLINEDGTVNTANAVSGPPLLLESAEQAAMTSRFQPVILSGRAVRVIGTIVYNFENPKPTTVRVEKMKVAPSTPAEIRKALMAVKLHAWLSAVVERLDKGDTCPGPNEPTFIHDDKADILIRLTTASPAVLEKLSAAGFELVAAKSKIEVVGKISLDKLAPLVDIPEVKLILPKI